MTAGRLCAAALLVLLAGPAAAAVELELPTVHSDRFFRLSEAGSRPVVVNLWDTDCPYCRLEMPMMDRLARALPDVLFIGIAMAPRRQTLDYLDSHPVSYPQLLAPRDPGALLRRLGDPSGALPHTVVLKPDHSICAYRTGEIDATWLRMVLQQCR